MSDDNDKKEDLTRIEDLSEYLHEDDPEEDFEFATHEDDSTPDDDIPSLPEDENDNEISDDDTGAASFEEEDTFSLDTSDFDDTSSGAEFGAEESFESESFESTESDDSFEPTEEDNAFEASADEETFESIDSDFSEDNEFGSDDSFSEEAADFGSDDSFSENANEFGAEETTEVETPEEVIDEETPMEAQAIFEEEVTDELDTVEEIPELPTASEMPEIPEIPEIEETKTPLALQTESEVVPTSDYKAPETFDDVKKFAENLSFGSGGQEGTPPYSILIKNIKYTEDAQALLSILEEFNLVNDETREQTSQTLSRGSYLISRLSEFTAIKLLHRIRHLDITYLSGLTESINPPKSYDSEDAGLATKRSIFGNKHNSYIMDRNPLELSEIMTSTMSVISGFEIMRYIGIASENTTIDPDLLNFQGNRIIDEMIETLPETEKWEQYNRNVAHENQKAASSQLPLNVLDESEETEARQQDRLNDVYEQLIIKLKAKALELEGNAVVGVNFNILPLPQDHYRTLYQVSCTGNVVWVSRH
jgi:uncharacterized protein YbjQ (UPF0145 family)